MDFVTWWECVGEEHYEKLRHEQILSCFDKDAVIEMARLAYDQGRHDQAYQDDQLPWQRSASHDEPTFVEGRGD
jgi:hypothetical protein